MDHVPDYSRFFTVDELLNHSRTVAFNHTDLVHYQNIGTSRNGEAISMLSIGNGTKSLLLYACPHPNEPIGSLLIDYLLSVLFDYSELLVTYTWHLIPCIDPDGTRLNEGWFSGPFTIRNYARYFYRPRTEEQVEWTFPITYKNYSWTTPSNETQALMYAIRLVQPDFLYGLHNSGFGGMYYYISQPLVDIFPELEQLPSTLGLYLAKGEAEAPWVTQYAPAIFSPLSLVGAYDYYEKYTTTDPVTMIVLLYIQNTVQGKDVKTIYDSLMDHVPDYSRFFTVDELLNHSRTVAFNHSDLVHYQNIGTSRNGEAISMLSIGNGTKSLLLYACPHPNEPIGSLLIDYLLSVLFDYSELLVTYTWHLIPCIDPDGTRLNEGWFSGPFTIRNYARYFYRPRTEEQVEWTFPITYKNYSWTAPSNETQALMYAIRLVQPDFLYGLHNSGFGGMYYYISQPLVDIFPELEQLPSTLGLYLAKGEAEAPWVTQYAPAIFSPLSLVGAYDYYEKYTTTDPVTMMYGGGTTVWIIIPILYYTNAWESQKMPIVSNSVFDINGYYYNTSKVLDNNSQLNETAYNIYGSDMRLPLGFVVVFGFTLAGFSAAIVHTILYHGKSCVEQFRISLEDQKNDVHAQLMSHYAEVPEFWYYILFVVSLILGTINGYHNELLSGHVLLITMILNIMFVVPFGFIMATTGFQI
ncbi:unnamed protein product, partial [Adineta steineri]